MNEEEKNIQENQNVNEAPATDQTVNNIVNSEAKDENAERIQGQVQNNADFTSMFGVQSEETAEEKELAKPVVEIPRVLEVKDEDREIKIEISEEEKKENRKKYFNNDEKLVYKIEPEKTGNPIVVLLFFLALIGFIIFLPNVAKKIDFDALFKTEQGTGTQTQTEEEDKFYRFESAASSAQVGDLTFINFVKSHENNEYKVSFTIQNNSEKIFQFDKKYYMVLYADGDDEFPLYYALIHSYNGIPVKDARETDITINKRAFEKATKFKIEEIPESKYPNVDLTTTKEEYRVLTCKYLNDTMYYYFKDGKLVKVEENYLEEANNNPQFDANLVKFKNLSEQYKKIENFDTVFVSSEGRFSQVNNINLSKISDNTMIGLKTYRFFRYNVDKNTVSFELQGQGYTCS